MTKVAAIGVGVIGGGWIARFVLHGHDVTIYDPDPEAPRMLSEMLANAKRAYRKLLRVPPEKEGAIRWAASVGEAVEGADYVQESVPERLDLKHKILAEIEAAAPSDAVVASSTSGFRPSQLGEGARHPERILVAHPFNPVYLLPLVEVVGGQGSIEAVARAEAVLSSISMKPVVLERETDAHIGDRLLEAVWREALWLVNDGVATTEQIDDVIRFSFGLRWAQMGLFETYRIAGGEAGMRHFLAQFGPALKWPWTKLMDVPELNEQLIERITLQSDAQSGQHSIRELERIRDDNLIGILQALKTNGWGAGISLRQMEERLETSATPSCGETQPAQDGDLLFLHATGVPSEWVDYNGHMTEFRYLQVFGDATDALLARIGVDADYLSQGCSVYTVETHIRHLGEVHEGQELRVGTQLLEHDEKRIRLLHRIFNKNNDLVATAEQMLLHVDTHAGKATSMAEPLLRKLDEIAAKQDSLPRPNWVGHGLRDLIPTGAAA